jgi:hypothetical protein
VPLADAFRGEVDREVGRLDDRRLIGRRRGAERDAHPGQQLVHSERLAHVIVRAGVERGDLLCLRGSRGEHDDRHRRPAAKSVDHLDAADVGKPEIEIALLLTLSIRGASDLCDSLAPAHLIGIADLLDLIAWQSRSTA